MLVAAGIDREAQLVADVEKAKQEWRAAADSVQRSISQLVWDRAEERLDRFRNSRQQVAGGEDPNQGCKE